MEDKGHEVEAPDLPGHGKDSTPISEVTLADYTDHVCEVLDESDDPVVLVGHSLGGSVISEAAERLPEKIGILAYLTAFLLPNGTSVREIGAADTESMLWPNIEPDEDEGGLTVKEEKRKDIFYQDCSEADVEWATQLFRTQPPTPATIPVRVTEDNFGNVKRAYIECMHDRVISPSLQKKMYTDLPCDTVISMNTGHFPQFAAPVEVANHLDSLARLN